MELRPAFAFDSQRDKQDGEAQNYEQPAEHGGEVTGAHAHRGSHLIVRERPRHGKTAESDEHHPSPEILRTLDFHTLLQPRPRRTGRCRARVFSASKCNMRHILAIPRLSPKFLRPLSVA